MFGWLKKRSRPHDPEAGWSVKFDSRLIRVVDDHGVERSIELDILSGVIIETNDTGPWGADVWWLLFDRDDRVVCAFPQGASGDRALVDYLIGLEGFDHAAMTSAMRSTDNAVFPVWRR